MARSYARISSAIWADRAFRELTSDAQRAYFVAFSQSSIGITGVVAYQPRRWATYAKDSTPRRLQKAVTELEAAGYILVDNEVEELLVRSFMRHEKVLSSPKLGASLARQLDEVLSPVLLNAVTNEIERLIGEDLNASGIDYFTKGLTRDFPQGYRIDHLIGYPQESDAVSDTPTGTRTGGRTRDPEPEPDPEPSSATGPYPIGVIR